MPAGNPDIAQELVALLPRLRRFAASLAGAGAQADDLVQDAIERALRKAHLWKPGTRLDSWVFRIMQNAWIDTVRAGKVRATSSIDVDGFDAAGIDGRTATEAAITLARVRAAMAKMTPEHRVVIGLVMVEGYSYREAAEILGGPEGTVTSRLFRARTALEASVFSTGAQGDAP